MDLLNWGPFHYMSNIVVPFCMNLFSIIFVCVVIDLNVYPTEPTNSIPIVMLFFLYLEGMAEFVCYYKAENGPEEIFGDRHWIFLVPFVIISYPVYFIFKLPFVIIRLFEKFGSPKAIWERIFSDTCYSLYYLSISNSDGCVTFCLRVIYLGIPFFIFALIYIVLMIVLSPLWLFIFSPIGLCCFGIAACITLLSNEEDTVTTEERTNRVYYQNQLIMLIRSTSGIIFMGCHLGLCGVHWCSVILLILFIFSFIMNLVYVIRETPDKCREGCCSCGSNQL